MSPIDRILTTHVGSLPRPDYICQLLLQKEQGELAADADFDSAVAQAVGEIVKKQSEIGIDLVSDGECSKIGYANYIKDRLTGFEGDSPRIPGADLKDFPDYAVVLGEWRKNALPLPRPCCRGPITVRSLAPLHADIENLNAACAQYQPVGAFMNAASPGVIAVFQPDEYYGNHGDYLNALSLAMREEYRAIIEGRSSIADRLPRPCHGAPHDLPRCHGGRIFGSCQSTGRRAE